MKSLHEQNHYEVLEVPRSAVREQIERAYLQAQAIYSSTSLACYSIYEERDIDALRDRIETAYRVLSDEDARDAYDRSIGGRGEGRAAATRQEGAGWQTVSLGRPERDADLPGASEAFRELESDIEEGDGEFDGATLRRARLRRGIELETIADVTKVSVRNLAHLENEHFDDLPAAVYVRGFLKAYATTIGLDPTRVAASYLKKLERAREIQARPRLLGRR